MSQSTHFVNCPHCGEIIEVVNPRSDVAPRSVKAATSVPFFSPPGESFEIRCPNQKCAFWIQILWYYAA